MTELTVTEGQTEDILVLCLNGSPVGVSTEYVTEEDSAKAGKEFVESRGSLEWDAGIVENHIRIETLEDNGRKWAEVFFVRLSNSDLDSRVMVTILDNDARLPDCQTGIAKSLEGQASEYYRGFPLWNGG